jgi:hypothetical protein
VITVSQLLGAIAGLEALGIDTSAAASLNLSSLSADAVVGEDILSVVAIFWPPAALLEAALVVAVEIAPLLPPISIKPDPNPEVDAQTTTGPGGRNG